MEGGRQGGRRRRMVTCCYINQYIMEKIPQPFVNFCKRPCDGCTRKRERGSEMEAGTACRRKYLSVIKMTCITLKNV